MSPLQTDIRDKALVCHQDILALNFIRQNERYVFRRHHRQGLRSHVIEVLEPEDVARECKGVQTGGIRYFPRAKPLKMLRIFRTRFVKKVEVFEETRRVKLVERFLGPCFYAASNEFIVTYDGPQKAEIILCGLQEYVDGKPLHPWGLFEAESEDPEAARNLQRNGADFVARVKEMVQQTGHIPDLAGLRNILVTPRGEIKLVDINNISQVVFDDEIRLDDRGYPVCDKSIEALARLEENLLKRRLNREEPLYALFLAPARMAAVTRIERRFHLSLNTGP